MSSLLIGFDLTVAVTLFYRRLSYSVSQVKTFHTMKELDKLKQNDCKATKLTDF